MNTRVKTTLRQARSRAFLRQGVVPELGGERRGARHGGRGELLAHGGHRAVLAHLGGGGRLYSHHHHNYAPP